jgi:hypothetical protein
MADGKNKQTKLKKKKLVLPHGDKPQMPPMLHDLQSPQNKQTKRNRQSDPVLPSTPKVEVDELARWNGRSSKSEGRGGVALPLLMILRRSQG